MLAFGHLQALHCISPLYPAPNYQEIKEHEQDRRQNKRLHSSHQIRPCKPDCAYLILPPHILFSLKREEMAMHAYCLTLNPNYTLLLNSYLPIERSLDLRLLIKSPYIRWRHIYPYMEAESMGVRYLDLAYVSRHKDIDLSFLLSTLDTVNWYWAGLSRNPEVPLWFILAHPDLPWNWAIVSEHRVTLETVLIYSHLPWVIKALSRNPTLTWRQIQEHNSRIKWDIKELAWNPFSHTNAARVIQRVWRRSITRLSSCL